MFTVCLFKMVSLEILSKNIPYFIFYSLQYFYSKDIILQCVVYSFRSLFKLNALTGRQPTLTFSTIFFNQSGKWGAIETNIETKYFLWIYVSFNPTITRLKFWNIRQVFPSKIYIPTLWSVYTCSQLLFSVSKSKEKDL